MLAGEPEAQVLIVSDGKRGHENQSRVVARMLGSAEPVVLRLRPRVEELPLRLRLALLGRGGISRLHAADLVRRNLQPEQTGEFRALAHAYHQAKGRLRFYIVSTGTPPATYNLVLARMLGGTAIVNMTPSLLPRRHFDLNIVPAHDLAHARQTPPGVLATRLALGYFDAPAAQALAGALVAQHGLDPAGRFLGVCIGGPSKELVFPPGWCAALVAALLQAAGALGLRVLLTTSRRTPEADTQAIAALMAQSPHAAYFLDAHADPLNPLPAFYALAQSIVITADSFSMASEAIHAGLTPLCAVPPGAKAGTKVQKSLAGLGASGVARLVETAATPDAAALAAALGGMPPRAVPNAEYAELRSQVREYLGLSA